jgi:hypothetical protein
VREAAARPLREDRLAVEGDLEVTPAAVDQPGTDAEPLLDPGRQTGGARAVVSNHAVFDRQVGHRFLRGESTRLG